MSAHRLGIVAALALAALVPRQSRAQEFIPPDRADRPPQAPADSASGFRIGVFGFSTRGGYQVNADNQAVLGSTVDIARLGLPQLRLRPSFEVGFGRSDNSLAFNLEIIYRFRSDDAEAIPYIGVGAGYYDDNRAKRGWPTFVLGFELPYQRSMSWLIEYHALDGVNRSRILIGLATRGGSRQ